MTTQFDRIPEGKGLFALIPDEVVINHTCHCKTAGEAPADSGLEQHVFTVDGEDFPFWVTARGPVVTRVHDDLFTVDVEIILVCKEKVPGEFHAYHPYLSVGIAAPGFPHSGSAPYIPVINGDEFPWLLTADGCQLNFGHKIVPVLRLAFFARHVTTNLTVEDRRDYGGEVFCAGGDLIARSD